MFPDPDDNIIQLSDRIKELSYTTGTNNMVLEGAAPGFSRFEDFYQQSGLVFYAITDGSHYEVGSGHYLSSGLDPFYSSDQIRRYPFRSTNSNNKIDWAAGTKEVFVTYPAPFTVITAYGVDDRFNQPERSGIAFWDNDGAASGTNILNYDSSGNWDKDNHFLGLHTHNPGYAIDIEGPAPYSIVKVSGLRLDASGIVFSGGYDGHGQHSTRQLHPFLMNQVDATTGSNAVIDVSGWVNESIILKTQAAGQVFSGPLNDCVGGCDDGYPAFRVLHLSDIPDLSSLYLTGYNIHPEAMSGIPFFHKSGVLTYDPGFVWDDTLNTLGINNAKPIAALDVVGNARISNNLTVGNNLTVSGNLDVAGTTTYIDSTNVTIWDKQLELASMSGNATHDQLDSYIDDGGVIVRSSGDGDSDTGDKKWTWQNSSNTWKAQTSNGVPIGVTASGMVFGNGTAISGAYVGGSGISINGFNIDIGNIFSVSGNDDAAYGRSTQNVHQADNIVVSGVSGVTSWITKTGTKTTIHIDPSFLSGVLQTQVTANATAALNRFPYASGVAHSGFFSEELHEVSGVGGLMAANSGALQYQLDNLGDVGEVNQSAFSIVAISGASPSTWHSTISSDTKTDTLVIDSGHDNSISIIPDFNNDRFVISGAHQFRLGADNTPSLSTNASGYIGHNDGITISGDSYITTTRVGDTIKIAWSGGDNAFNWFKGDPATTLGAINSSTMVDADKMLVFDTDASIWKTTLLSELATELNTDRFPYASGVAHSGFFSEELHEVSGIGGLMAANSGHFNYITYASGQNIRDYAASLIGVDSFNSESGVLHSGFFSEELHEVSGVGGLMAANSGFFSEELHEVSGVGGITLAHSGALQYQLTEISGINNDYGWFPSPNTLATIDDTHLDDANDKILLWDNTGGSGWKSLTIGELDDKIGAGADAGDPDQNIFNSVQVQTIAQMGAQHWAYGAGGFYKDNTNIDAGSVSDNLFFIGDTPSGIAVNLIESGVNKYIKISSSLGGDITANSGFFSEELHEVSGIGGLMAANSGFFSEELHEVSGIGGLMAANSGHFNYITYASGQNLRDYTDSFAGNRFPYASGVAHSGFFSEELHEVSGVGGLMVVQSGFFSEELHEVSGVGGITLAHSGHFQEGINDRFPYASGVAHSGFFSEELHEVSGVGGITLAHSGHFQEGIDNRFPYASGVAHSGFFDQEVLMLDQRISDSGVAVSGFCTVYTGSGIDVYAHSATSSSRTLNLHSDWYRKDKGSNYILPTYDLVSQEGLRNIILGAHAEADPKANSNGSIVLGNYAGGGGNDTESHRNTLIGFKAGYFLGTGLSEYNVFLGSQAGEADVNYHSELQVGNICLGAQAGQGRKESSEGNIFLGRFAGNKTTSHISKGDYNITIGSFPADGSAIDAVNINTDHDYNLNIANLITADWSAGSTYSKRVKIGDISAGTVQPQGTLELKAVNTTTTTFFISRTTSQSSPLMQTQTPAYNYNDLSSTGETTNPIIGNEGFLRIPQFNSLTDLLACAAADHPGMLAMYYTCNTRDSIRTWIMVFSDGTRWKSVGDIQRSVQGGVWSEC